ncbi:MAG TPA: carboxymuconolactone decarboxylase family protein [Amnibacterium sp.]|jgi:alkylhydroperoxidase family enzyme|nr:carboxymuconolactone decarboxylase family protein [Amnibacterium sp.]
MSLIRTLEGEPTSDAAKDMYASEQRRWGYLPNYAPLFALRPDVYAGWVALNGSVKRGMTARQYELATLGAALALGSSYCSLAHGEMLVSDHLTADQVAAIARGEDAGLDAADRAVVAFAGLVARNASRVTEDDLTPLRDAGLTDDEIFGVVLAAAARCFFSTVLDATGTLANVEFASMPSDLRDALTVGRPIATA